MDDLTLHALAAHRADDPLSRPDLPAEAIILNPCPACSRPVTNAAMLIGDAHLVVTPGLPRVTALRPTETGWTATQDVPLVVTTCTGRPT